MVAGTLHVPVPGRGVCRLRCQEILPRPMATGLRTLAESWSSYNAYGRWSIRVTSNWAFL
jgi:hypothetical protein